MVLFETVGRIGPGLLLILGWAVVACPGQQAQEPSVMERFRQLDRNGDQQLTRDELDRPRLFQWLDQNHDGSVMPAEARAAWAERSASADPREFAYGNHPQQRLDVHASSANASPPSTKTRPVMIYVHGGGWKRGDKRAVGLKPDFFADLGWVFVSLNYRLLPAGKHPANVNDVAAAIDWVHNNIENHGGDPDRIFLMGHSAGAHLVALVATDERRLKKHGHELDLIRGVISLDTNAYDVNRQVNGSSDLYRQVFGDDPDAHRDASPLYHVAAGKSIPPFLIAFSRGMSSRTNPLRQAAAQQFASRLRDADVASKVVDASDRNHGQINQWFGRADDSRVTEVTQKFLARLAAAPQREASDGDQR